MSWDTWREAQYRKRAQISWAISLGALLLAVLTLWFAGLNHLLRLSDTQGDAIAVKLGSPDGENLPLKVNPLPDPAFVPEQAVSTESQTMPLPLSQEPTPKTTESKRISTPTVPKVIPSPSKPQQQVRVVKGSETGNSMETIFQGGAGHVGRSLYVPIYLYMPLPTRLTRTLLSKIPDSQDGFETAQQRKDELLAFYSRDGSEWRLRAQPPFDTRPRLWLTLQDAGYNLADAEYKQGNLSPVTLSFTLSAPHNGQPPVLLKVTLEHSSGNEDVDAAVLYGFRMSAFANGTGKDAPGLFTYDFNEK